MIGLLSFSILFKPSYSPPVLPNSLWCSLTPSVSACLPWANLPSNATGNHWLVPFGNLQQPETCSCTYSLRDRNPKNKYGSISCQMHVPNKRVPIFIVRYIGEGPR